MLPAMKKIAHLFAFGLCLMALFTLSSCQKNEKLILGTWNLSTITLDSQDLPVGLLGDLDITFKESGSYSIDFEISPLATMLVEEVLGSNPDIFGEEAASAEMLLAMLGMLDGMTGTYTIDKDRFDMSLFFTTIGGDIMVLDKEQFGFKSTIESNSVVFNFVKD